MRTPDPSLVSSYHAIPCRNPTSFHPFWWMVTRLVSQQPGLWLSRCSVGVWAGSAILPSTGITSPFRSPLVQLTISGTVFNNRSPNRGTPKLSIRSLLPSLHDIKQKLHFFLGKVNYSMGKCKSVIGCDQHQNVAPESDRKYLAL